jgi:hypothetical protein
VTQKYVGGGAQWVSASESTSSNGFKHISSALVEREEQQQQQQQQQQGSKRSQGQGLEVSLGFEDELPGLGLILEESADSPRRLPQSVPSNEFANIAVSASQYAASEPGVVTGTDRGGDHMGEVTGNSAAAMSSSDSDPLRRLSAEAVLSPSNIVPDVPIDISTIDRQPVRLLVEASNSDIERSNGGDGRAAVSTPAATEGQPEDVPVTVSSRSARGRRRSSGRVVPL